MESPSNAVRINGRIEKLPSAATAEQFFTDPAGFAAEAGKKLADHFDSRAATYRKHRIPPAGRDRYV
jgi:hypothetical protein